ncbi:hypothetical protein SAMN05920897_10647 [Alkalispirochaeta americana]|uniref:Uncharacterized protein n=1 Tax=Alkalispirochaeta americana TaxID=159291 RepID=A0A1N6RCI4_9SPIO|nr:hypothetical protein SAMN05920897_10647 [Alkalispirochaeta americana]
MLHLLHRSQAAPQFVYRPHFERYPVARSLKTGRWLQPDTASPQEALLNRLDSPLEAAQPGIAAVQKLPKGLLGPAPTASVFPGERSENLLEGGLLPSPAEVVRRCEELATTAERERLCQFQHGPQELPGKSRDPFSRPHIQKVPLQSFLQTFRQSPIPHYQGPHGPGGAHQIIGIVGADLAGCLVNPVHLAPAVAAGPGFLGQGRAQQRGVTLLHIHQHRREEIVPGESLQKTVPPDQTKRSLHIGYLPVCLIRLFPAGVPVAKETRQIFPRPPCFEGVGQESDHQGTYPCHRSG